MKKTLGVVISLVALSLTSWAARKQQRKAQRSSAAVAQPPEPGNLTLVGLAVAALAASLGYEK